MKYLLTPLFLIIFVGFGQAQGNLQFNQAKIISNTDPMQTVPAGKVWKIESVFTAGDQDVYGVQTEMSEKSYLLAGNNSLQKNVDQINAEKTAEDIEMSEALINEQKQLRRKQRMQKTFGDDSLELALLENDSEKTEKISDKKAAIKVKVNPAPDQKDQQGGFIEKVQKILKN